MYGQIGCFLLGLAAAATIGFSAAANPYSFPAPDSAEADGPPLVIYSNTDIEAAGPIVAGFQQRFPNIAVVYHDLQSIEIYDRVLAESGENGPTADLALSSAMDLQVKLVNDGYATQWDTADASALPSWAVWRNTAFGVTYEPAVIVYNKPFFGDRPLPKTRADLADMLQDQASPLFGKVATYDIERSGLGFLFLARDQEHSSAIWRLVNLMGAQNVKLYTNSAAIIERVADGRFLIGYNILGSYAKRMAKTRPDLGIVVPEDYTIVLSRIALIPSDARSPELGALFLEFLLSIEGQGILARSAGLNAIRRDIVGPGTAADLRVSLGTRARPVRVGPGLLVYLDQAKRRRILERWNAALVGR